MLLPGASCGGGGERGPSSGRGRASPEAGQPVPHADDPGSKSEAAVPTGVGTTPDASLPVPDEAGLSPSYKRVYALPLNNPSLVPAAEASHMRPDDRVVGVVVAEQPRAYPWWILSNYHVVNDTIITAAAQVESLAPRMHAAIQRERSAAIDRVREIGRDKSNSGWAQHHVPVTVTLCEACTGAAAFVSAVQDTSELAARPLVFSMCTSKGNPTGDYRAIGVYTICDAQTHSRWHPFSGLSYSGPLAGKRLQRVHAFMETWDRWVRVHPDTTVAFADRQEMDARLHGSRNRRNAQVPNSAFGRGLHSSFWWWLREHPDEEDQRLPRTEIVLGVAHEGQALAVPLKELIAKGRVWNHEIGAEPYVFLLQGELMGVVYSRRLGDEILSFTIESEDPIVVRDASGTRWDLRGRALDGPYKGRALDLAEESYVVYWVDWSMNHPATALLGESTSP
ncbi:MAG: DUF3179 domain-containing (seleno)protein [Myxococcota bacterium]